MKFCVPHGSLKIPSLHVEEWFLALQFVHLIEDTTNAFSRLIFRKKIKNLRLPNSNRKLFDIFREGKFQTNYLALRT